MNDAGFFPELNVLDYPRLMHLARSTLENLDARVCDGHAYVGQMHLRDSMHFHVGSTPQVVRMYSEVVIERMLDSSVNRSAPLTGAVGQEMPSLVCEFSKNVVSRMLTDPASISSENTSMLKSELHHELETFDELICRKGRVDWRSRCSSARCGGILDNKAWLRI